MFQVPKVTLFRASGRVRPQNEILETFNADVNIADAKIHSDPEIRLRLTEKPMEVGGGTLHRLQMSKKYFIVHFIILPGLGPSWPSPALYMPSMYPLHTDQKDPRAGFGPGGRAGVPAYPA